MATVSPLMKCDSCPEKATVFYTQVSDGKLKKYVLCARCAEAAGITSPEGLFLSKDLLGMGAAQVPELAKEEIPSPEREEVPELQAECEDCGFTIEDFRKVGRMGCSSCYEAFMSDILQRLPSMHKGAEHQGYMPEGIAKQQARVKEIARLEGQLEKAVEAEDFEEAATLRDRIQELKKDEKGGKA